MKHFWLLASYSLVILAGIAGCKGTTQTPVADAKSTPAAAAALPLEEQIKLRTEAELKRKVRKDTVILDFRFGMTKQQVYEHTKLMEQRKKMYGVCISARAREFVYDLELRQSGNLRTRFDASYAANHLYQVVCKPDMPKGANPSKVLAETLELYELKYNKPHFTKPAKADGCETYLWIDGNRQIELTCQDKQVTITYYDLSVQQTAGKKLDI